MKLFNMCLTFVLLIGLYFNRLCNIDLPKSRIFAINLFSN